MGITNFWINTTATKTENKSKYCLLQGIDYEFCPGDTIGILPSNADSDVNNLIQILQLEEVADLEYSISILQNTKKRNALLPKHIPKSGTIRNLLLKNLDLRSPPKKVGTYL